MQLLLFDGYTFLGAASSVTFSIVFGFYLPHILDTFRFQIFRYCEMFLISRVRQTFRKVCYLFRKCLHATLCKTRNYFVSSVSLVAPDRLDYLLLCYRPIVHLRNDKIQRQKYLKWYLEGRGYETNFTAIAINRNTRTRIQRIFQRAKKFASV